MPYHCIRGNFHHQLEELEDEPWNSPSSTPGKTSPSLTPRKSSPSSTPKRSSPCSTPRKSKKSSKNSKSNPFASRGLDKFSALLAELEEKRQKIYSRMGSEDAVPMVRFVYSSSNDCIPIVVKVKDHQKQDKTKNGTGTTDHVKDRHIGTHRTEIVDKLPEKSTSVPGQKQVEQPTSESDKKAQMNNSKLFELNKKLHNWRRPSYYMPAAIVLILLLLLFFGRSVVILCISLGWYIVPTLSTDMPTKKKEYVRRLSENKMVMNHGVITSPRRNSMGDVIDKWPHQLHGQRKSF